MKFNKSLLIVTISLATSIAAQAQQEEKTVKALPAGITKSPAVDSKPSVIPVIKEIAADVVPASPSRFTREDNTKITSQENITFKTFDDKAAGNQLTPDQINTLKGNAKLPKQSAGTPPGTENIKPLPLPKPVLAKEQ